MIIFRCIATVTEVLPICVGILNQTKRKVHFKLWANWNEEGTSRVQSAPRETAPALAVLWMATIKKWIFC